MPGVRVDTGVIAGGEVPVHYDPLIAKLIACGESRDAARRRAVAALREFPVLGILTNVPLLVDVLEHERFADGNVDTHFLDVEGKTLPAARQAAPSPLAAAVAVAARAPGMAAASPRHVDTGAVDPWTMLRDVRV